MRRGEPEDAFRRLENPRAETHEPGTMRRPVRSRACPRTVSPSLHARLASDEAVSFLPASALRRRGGLGNRDLVAVKTRDASDRRLPPEHDGVEPYLVRSWQAPQLSLRAGGGGSGPHAARPGKGAFHDTPPRFGGSSWNTFCRAPGLPPALRDQGPVRPEVLHPTVPLTPLSLRSHEPIAPGLRPWVAPRSCSHETRRSVRSREAEVAFPARS